MAQRSYQSVTLQLLRVSGWLLMVLVPLYLATGFSLGGKFGMNRLIDVQTALAVHRLFDWPLVAAVAVHATTTAYFAMRRWGWIRK